MLNDTAWEDRPGAEYDDSYDQLLVKCAEAGLSIDIPGDDELQVDIDSPEDFGRFKRALPILMDRFALDYDAIRCTKSRRKEHGLHIRIQLPSQYDQVERIAMQAALGSDGVRELLSLCGVWNEDFAPTLFIEKQGWEAETIDVRELLDE